MINFVGNSELYISSLYKLSTINECVEWLSKLESIALDTETEGFFDHSNKIVMLQLYHPKDDTSWVIDVRYTNILPLKHILENILILGQNLKFDYKFLKLHGIELNNIYDTLLAECCLTNGLENRQLALNHLAKKYANIDLDKSVRNQFTSLNGEPFTEKQIVYGIGDVKSLYIIKEKQEEQIKSLNIDGWVNNEFKACLALGDIEYHGMGFNGLEWLKMAKNSQNLVSSYEAELDEYVRLEPKLAKYVLKKVQGNLFADIEEGYTHGRDINIKWSSPTQMSKVFNDLGLNLESTLERHLTKHQNQYPLVKKFIDYKKEQKLVTTYGENFIKYVNPVTNRIHTSFWQILDTSRISSGDKTSPNMQNLPAKREYRNCFIPKPGFKMVSVDFSGQELRLVAEGSKEPLWVDAFNNGEDLHSKVASMVFNIPLENVRNKPEFLRGKSYRDAAKIVNFGLIYGMSKFKLADTLDITIEDAGSIIIDYFKATQQLNNYLENCRNYGIKYGYIKSFKPYSIIRWFPQWTKDLNKYKDYKVFGSIERASMNSPIQASGAQMTKLALWKLRQYIKIHNLQDKVQIVMTVHDQIDCEVVASFAEEWSLIQKKIMEEAGKEIIKIVPTLSDITISDVWTK